MRSQRMRILLRATAIVLAVVLAALWCALASNRQRRAAARVLWTKLTPDGSTLSAAFSDESIRGYDAANGRLRFQFNGFRGQSTNPVSYGDSPLFFVQFVRRVRGFLQTIGDLPGMASLKRRTVWIERDTAIVDPTAGALAFRNTTADDIDELPVLGATPDRFIVWSLNHKSGAQKMRVFDRRDAVRPIAVLNLPDPVDEPILSTDGKWIGCWRQRTARVLLFDAATGQPHPVCEHLPDNVASSAWAMSNDGQALVLGLRSGHIELWNLQSRARIASYGPQSGIPERIVIADDDKSFACAAQNGELYVGRMSGGQLLFRSWLDGQPAADIRMLAKVNRIAVLDRSNTVRWWPLERHDGVPLGVLGPLPGEVGPMHLTEDGALLASRGSIVGLTDLSGAGKDKTIAAGDGGSVLHWSVANRSPVFAAATQSDLQIRSIEDGAAIATCWTAAQSLQEYYQWLAWSGPTFLFAIISLPAAIWIGTKQTYETKS